MDSLTQIALGAAVGQAAVGKEAGWRGATWGAVLGTLPDLDILAYPFLDSVGQLAIHRGFSHSALFAVAAAPVVGRLLWSLHGLVTRRRWAWMTFWVLSTHVLLDCFTVYGTQVLWPFTDYPVSFNSLFIIDPLYTTWLVVGVLTALFMKRGSRRRRAANTLGLAMSTLYVVWSLGAKTIAHDALTRGWAAAGLDPERTMSNPMPLSTVLWMGLAEQNDTLYASVYSLLDSGPPTTGLAIPKRSELLDGLEGDRAVARLLRFSKGWYAASRPNGGLLFDDLRFGRYDNWLSDGGDPVFRFELLPGDCGDPWCGFRQVPGSGDFETFFGGVWDRVWGVSSGS